MELAADREPLRGAAVGPFGTEPSEDDPAGPGAWATIWRRFRSDYVASAPTSSVATS
jgi:hypothetical protein